MTPDYDAAATQAAYTLIHHHVSFAPVEPLPFLKKTKGVIVLTFAEMAIRMGTDRQSVLSTFSSDNRDVVTSVCPAGDKLRYIVAYNQRLPFYMLQRAIARELGHIVLRHDGSRPEDVRAAEAQCFAYHLLCPRPLIRALQEAEIPITIETIGNVTGCYERCMAGIRKTPATHVPAELNRKIKEQFADYVENFIDCKSLMMKDDTPIADFGTYMDGYEE